VNIFYNSHSLLFPAYSHRVRGIFCPEDGNPLLCRNTGTVCFLLQGWESVWLCSLGAETHAAAHPDLAWLPPLWSSRDTVVRSAALQLVAGFCASRQACAQLLPGLPAVAGGLWSAGLRSDCMPYSCHGLLLAACPTDAGNSFNIILLSMQRSLAPPSVLF
jgi:hypothetical protein